MFDEAKGDAESVRARHEAEDGGGDAAPFASRPTRLCGVYLFPGIRKREKHFEVLRCCCTDDDDDVREEEETGGLVLDAIDDV